MLLLKRSGFVVVLWLVWLLKGNRQRPSPERETLRHTCVRLHAVVLSSHTINEKWLSYMEYGREAIDSEFLKYTHTFVWLRAEKPSKRADRHAHSRTDSVCLGLASVRCLYILLSSSFVVLLSSLPGSVFVYQLLSLPHFLHLALCYIFCSAPPVFLSRVLLAGCQQKEYSNSCVCVCVHVRESQRRRRS